MAAVRAQHFDLFPMCVGRCVRAPQVPTIFGIDVSVCVSNDHRRCGVAAESQPGRLTKGSVIYAGTDKTHTFIYVASLIVDAQQHEHERGGRPHRILRFNERKSVRISVGFLLLLLCLLCCPNDNGAGGGILQV